MTDHQTPKPYVLNRDRKTRGSILLGSFLIILIYLIIASAFPEWSLVAAVACLVMFSSFFFTPYVEVHPDRTIVTYIRLVNDRDIRRKTYVVDDHDVIVVRVHNTSDTQSFAVYLDSSKSPKPILLQHVTSMEEGAELAAAIEASLRVKWIRRDDNSIFPKSIAVKVN
jgi:hypothetical protein